MQSTEILSDIVHFMKYAKYMPEKARRETYAETVTRNMQMHLKKFPELESEIRDAYQFVYDKKVLPSMRSMQFAGPAAEINNARIFNCSYLPVDHTDAFSEIMFLLLSGCGVGFSVQHHHIKQLPEIKGLRKTQQGKIRKRKFIIGDSIEGWADSVKILVEAYFYGKSDPVFVFDGIRQKGARLITSGGKAPGPEPLHDCLHNIRKVLSRKQTGEKLSSLEVHDIVCYIADAVLAGGIRRAALISLFSFNDVEMMTCKTNNFWELNPQRQRANNSAMTLRHMVTKENFDSLWHRIKHSKNGEPAIYFSNNQDWGANPCVEIGLRPNQFCNLVEINGSNITSQEDLNERCAAGTFIGTLQASYTDFHYLREIWRDTTEKEALIGVSITGIASGCLDGLDLKEASGLIKSVNESVSRVIGINRAARTTCVKPAGTTSCIFGTSSGIHSWYNTFYIRRVRVGKNEEIYNYLLVNHPELIEDDFHDPLKSAVISVPIKAPDGAITRDESLDNVLARIKKFNLEWVRGGHVSGQNPNNVSATVYVKDDEWDKLGKWAWENRGTFSGLSTLPYDNGNYIQAPHEDCTEEEYNELVKSLTNIDLTNIVEYEDYTDLQSELACAGGACEIT